jgi:glutathione S-transferase
MIKLTEAREITPYKFGCIQTKSAKHVLDELQVPAKKRTDESWKERVPKYLGYFEDLLKANGGTYVTGRRLTYVDLSLFQIVEGL